MIGNHLWNATRVQRFLHELGVRPTRWEENIAQLALIGRMSVEDFLKTDPISYGVRVWGYEEHKAIKKVLGIINFHQLWHYYAAAKERDEAAKALLALGHVPTETLEEQVKVALKNYQRAAAEYDECLMFGGVDDETYASSSKAAYDEVTRTATIFVDLEKKIDQAEQQRTKWTCPSCTAVWRTKTD